MIPEELGLKTFEDFEQHKPFYERWFKRWYPTPDKGIYYYLRLRTYMAATGTDGDPSFAAKGLWEVHQKLLRGDPLDQADQWFLAIVISRVGTHPVVLNAVSGREGKRGAGKQGMKGLRVANEVRGRLAAGAPTTTEAINQVAEKRHLSESMVEKYWNEWKDYADESHKLEKHLSMRRDEAQSKA